MRGGSSHFQPDNPSVLDVILEEDKSTASRSSERKSKKNDLPRRKGTRSYPKRPTRKPKSIDKYVAEPACATNRTGHTPWAKVNDDLHTLKVQNKSLQYMTKALELELSKSHAEMHKLNKQLLSANLQGDSQPFSPNDMPNPNADPFQTSDMKSLLRRFSRANRRA